jgi:hypothetical protein
MTLSDSAELRDEAPHPVTDPHAAHVANRLGGALAMLVTYGIGQIVGTTI